ncbi:MFS transporter [Enterococcus faecalis]|uniref:MFS transporter n=1 Tax=Enterococcus faecalis TaxID=1351 RepID=A0AC59HMV0_ENTFL|nr:MFS transporter [Enterococcus faecalis]
MEKKISPNLTLFALAINAFAIGSTEFISVGLLPMIVKSFHISLSQAGLTVSLYALGVTIGAPLLTILTGKWNRRSLMLGIMLLFISGNLIGCVCANVYYFIGRADTFCIGAWHFHVCFDCHRRRCCAAITSSQCHCYYVYGVNGATVTGVPLGTFIGQQTAWHMSFLFIASIGLVGLIASYFLVPKNLPIPGKVDLKGITRIFTNKPLVFSFLITAFGYGGTFAAYTYLSPLLENLGFSANAVVIILVVYGVMVAIGNTVGGHWANKKPLDSLVKMFSLLILSLVFLFITVLMDNSLLGLLASLMLGLFAFMNVPGLQLYVVELAEKYVPEDITLASAFNIAAFNIGITVGSMTGGVVTDHLSVTYTPIFGGFIVLIAVLFVLYIRKQEEQKNNYL